MLRFLLLQVRNPDDPMRANELAAFSRSIGCPPESIEVLDALSEELTLERLGGVGMVLIGGSGNYSAIGNDGWLLRTLDGLRLIYEQRTPLFASCWGFQALARALGGEVINDPSRAEIGTHELRLTEAGRRDPLFGKLPDPFLVQMGHEDRVSRLPPGAVRLAYSERVDNQAYTFPDRPIYAAQFHAELQASDLLVRVRQYPEYLQLVTGLTLEAFAQRTFDTPDSNALVKRFVEMIDPADK